MAISSGTVFVSLKDYLQSSIRFGNYTIDEPDSDSINSVQLPDGTIEYQEPRTGFVCPVEDLSIADSEDRTSRYATGTFSFQILSRFSGENSYEQLTPYIANAHDISNDALLVLTNFPAEVHPDIISISPVQHDPIAVMRLDGALDGDWVIAIVPKFKITWDAGYSGNVLITPTDPPDPEVDPPTDLTVKAGIYIVEPGFIGVENEDKRNKELDGNLTKPNKD